MRKIVAMVILGMVAICGSVKAACYNECKPVPDCAEMGYKLESEIFCPDGAITCPFDSHYKWCKEYKCEDGRYSDNKTLTGERGFRCDEVDYHHRTCYNCRCAPDPEECKWSNLNKGNGELGDRCCDGHFAICTNLCQDTVEVPENAHGIKESCTGCQETKDIITSWECDEWYDQMGEKCYPRPCEGDASIVWPDLNHCGKKGLGEKGWIWQSHGMSGENVCGECIAKSCEEGYSTSDDVSDCGYAGIKYAKKVASQTQYNGDNTCYKCVCNAPESCQWTDGEQGTGTLGEKCCNGKYESCTSNCKENNPPENAECTNHCTGCGNTVCTGWTCKQGYTANGNRCDIATCPKGSATSEADCGKEASGWRLGAVTGYSGANACKVCEAKDCPDGSNIKYQSVSDCAEGCATYNIKGYSGDQKCGVCYYTVDEVVPPHAKCTYTTKCERGTACTKWECDEWYKKDGSVCAPADCPSGYSAEVQNTDNCSPAGSGWRITYSGQSGEKKCGQCVCESNCHWNNTNKGNATLADPCCNNNYATCTNNCKKVEIPQNASCASDGMCTGCEEASVCTKWACNQGFEKTTDEKGCCIRMLEPSENCVVGDVYYSNGKCGKADNYSSINCQGYIPVGVVYFVEGDYMRVIGLKDLTSNSTTWEFEPNKAFTNSRRRVAWGNYYTDIPTLTSYALESVSSDTQNGAGVYPILRTLVFPLLLRARDHELFDGKTNTKLQSQSKSAYAQCLNGDSEYKEGTQNYPKFCKPSIGLAALSFCPPNVNCEDKLVGKGQWYVPAVGEWMELTGYDFAKFTEVRGSGEAPGATKKVYETVTATLTTLIKNGADAEKFMNELYWTSNESRDQNGIMYGPDTGHISITLKSMLNTRLGLEIGCPKDALESKPQHADNIFAEASKCTTKSGQTKYKTFECQDGYAKKGNTCVKGCAIGDVYYDDGTCGKVWNYDKTKSKKAVGVVFYVADNHQSGKVVNFRLLATDETHTFNPEQPYNGHVGDKTMFWGLNNVTLSNITFEADKLLEALKSKNEWVFNGENNTKWILEQKVTSCKQTEGTETYNQFCQASAAKAAREFYPPETTKENAFAGAGKWHFASFGEMMLMFGYDPDKVTAAEETSGMTALVYAKLNSTMSALKNGLDVDARTMSGVKYISSNRWNNQKPWSIDFSTGKRLKDYNDGGNMRPVLDFTYKESK